MKKLTAKKKIRQIRMLKKNLKKVEKRKNKKEKERNLKRGKKSWYDLRTLKKLKLKMKDELAKK